MTEKQIQQLKQALSKSHAMHDSDALDRNVLNAAKLHANEIKKAKHVDSSDKQGGSLLTMIGSLSIAATFTVVVFLGLGHMLSVNDEAVIAKQVTPTGVQESFQFSDKPSEATLDTVNQEPNVIAQANNIAKPNNVPLEAAPTQLSRDEILMHFDLSETKELLAAMSSEFVSDSSSELPAVHLAMSDIQSLINVGEFDGARSRYHEFRQNEFKVDCEQCTLPESLEGLIIAVTQLPKRIKPQETG